MKYEKFELNLVAEYLVYDGTKNCVVLHPEAHVDSVKYLHDVEEDSNCLNIFWTIYGVKPDGTSEALIDGEDEQDMKAKFDFLQGLIEVKEVCVTAIEYIESLQLKIGLSGKELAYLNLFLRVVEEKLA